MCAKVTEVEHALEDVRELLSQNTRKIGMATDGNMSGYRLFRMWLRKMLGGSTSAPSSHSY